jgi:hypothetical protein
MAIPLKYAIFAVDKPLDAVALHGKVQFKHDVYRFENGINKKTVTYVSRPFVNPTWRQLVLVVDDMIEKTGDKHHVYFEGVSKAPDHPGYYEFDMAS